MKYFESRSQAGDIISKDLVDKYRYEDSAVVALNTGGVMVGEAIATRLHCPLMMLISEDIDIPGEGMSFGGVSQSGTFTYDSGLSAGEISHYTNEFHGYLDEQKRAAFQRINRLVGDGGTIDASLLKERVVILVSDGLGNNDTIDSALDFLKPIKIKKLVVATPIATVAAVDRVHIAADEIHILDVKENYFGSAHYYDEKDVITREEAVKHINKAIMKWL